MAGLEVPSQHEICTLSTSTTFSFSPGSNDQLSDCLIGRKLYLTQLL